jgi:16S rRNA (guanine966-N2)-methyltransferase
MRVIGGTFGGRRIRAVEGHVTRPTSDRVREALFSRIEARYGLDGAIILDVFAGTGALAIEAVSRGARRASCIEIERRAVETLKTNLRELGLEESVRVYNDDYRRVLARLGGKPPGQSAAEFALSRGDAARSSPRSAGSPLLPLRKRRFDGVFVDPPYGKGLGADALEALARFGLVRPGGWISVEVGRREETPEVVEGPDETLGRVREDVYGDTKLALYEARAVRRRAEAGSDPDSAEEPAVLSTQQSGQRPAEVQR